MHTSFIHDYMANYIFPMPGNLIVQNVFIICSKYIHVVEQMDPCKYIFFSNLAPKINKTWHIPNESLEHQESGNWNYPN